MVSKASDKSKAEKLDVKALLLAEIGRARAALENAELDRESRIHAARRALKRARSMLRILRPVLGEEDYDRRRIALRDAAADLSGTRDLDVMAGTAAKLRSEAPDKLHPAVDELATRLAEEAERAHTHETPIETVAEKLRAAEADTDALPEPKKGTKLFLQELARAYKAAHKAMETAAAGVGEHRFHEWRKRVKHNWHLAKLVKSDGDLISKKTVKRLDELGEFLGQENDHAVLSAKLLDDPLLAGDGPSADRVHDIIDARRAELQKTAFKLGQKLYGETPKAFRARIEIA